MIDANSPIDEHDEPAPPTSRPQATACDLGRLRGAIVSLREASATRAKLEQSIEAEATRNTDATNAEAEKLRQATVAQYDEEIAATRRRYQAERKKVEAHFAAAGKKVDDQSRQMQARIKAQWRKNDDAVKEDEQFGDSTQKEAHKERRREPIRAFARDEKGLGGIAGELDETLSRAATVLAARSIHAEEPAEMAADDGPGELPAGQAILEHVSGLRKGVAATMERLTRLPGARRAFASATPIAITVVPLVPAIGLGLAAALLLPLEPMLRIAAGVGSGVLVEAVAAGVGLWWLWRRRKRLREESRSLFGDLQRESAELRRAIEAAKAFITSRRDERIAAVDRDYEAEVTARKSQVRERLEQLAAKRDHDLETLAAKAAAAVEAATAKRQQLFDAIEGKYPPHIEKLERQKTEKLDAIAATREERLAEIGTRRETAWAAMVEAWRAARLAADATISAAVKEDAAAFPPFERLASDDSAFPAEAPGGVRFGEIDVSLEAISGGISPHEELNSFGPTSWKQPAFVPFPDASSLLIRTSADQAAEASEMMHALMLRIATGIPPGQTRFTIIDPLGLGKHFAAFMHLADFDELLVTSRIWTEPAQIEQRLFDITEQMELVIQKYLRNEYASIGDYNADAEVPEPYRFVVVANFPSNFTETAARRLMSIASSGARCGVSVVVSVDRSQPMPPNFSLDDFAKHANTLVLEKGRFTWEDPEFSHWPLTVERSPPDETVTRIVQAVGRLAKAAKRVEVPFERVAPKEEDWWTGSTASEINVPLGPAGAKKMQHMRLGKGTSQHVLIAGKTGSGKSTMMHALITNLALTYSPNEVQFYLIDFKKGVEFKVYDHYALPHARVIAIESEREFGLSVLQQLDRELKRRGDLFRDLAVQDLAGFRGSGHPDPMPRVLLIIDEFQELFIEDDKLAQDASLVLDRLVRQGRAFGMHVLLGSQTLGGSYSLPRSTMGQMAVRVALQCNEADSSLILSEENSAARLLTRPGEAIYNDANGMVAGNNPFQVVWLGDERRERYLGALRKLADRRADIPELPRIVFDGNEAADPTGNSLLTELLAKGTIDGKEPLAPVAWLGDAIAIKDPTAAPFRRQGGSNLLVVGQRQDLAVSLLAMSMVSLAAGHDPHPGGGLGRACRFVLFEPAVAEEHPETMLANLDELLPHRIEQVNRLAVGEAVDRVADEVQRRIDEQVLDGEAVFLVVRDLARFRDLRKSEGDFGFSFGGGEKKANPAQRFLDILRDGPAVGVHVLVWCDSLTNLMRTFERGTLKEFELRVLFQMSGSDSSQLVETPVASKLGPQRALFIHEETGTLEKFRPYAFPNDEWLAEVSGQMKARPQGTPAPEPEPKPASPKSDEPPQADDGEQFNFTSFLDDPPPLDPETPKASGSDESHSTG
jgi:DNA segregation ATPase FtsK/SpoIIIE, S-DNA-T family